jgi:hypothetical protein
MDPGATLAREDDERGADLSDSSGAVERPEAF